MIIRMTGALALILGLMLGMAFLLRKWGGMGGKAGTRYIEIIENRLLLPKRHVSLIRVAGHYFLIGSTERGMNLLGRMEGKDMEAFERMIREGSGETAMGEESTR